MPFVYAQTVTQPDTTIDLVGAYSDGSGATTLASDIGKALSIGPHWGDEIREAGLSGLPIGFSGDRYWYDDGAMTTSEIDSLNALAVSHVDSAPAEPNALGNLIAYAKTLINDPTLITNEQARELLACVRLAHPDVDVGHEFGQSGTDSNAEGDLAIT